MLTERVYTKRIFTTLVIVPTQMCENVRKSLNLPFDKFNKSISNGRN